MRTSLLLRPSFLAATMSAQAVTIGLSSEGVKDETDINLNVVDELVLDQDGG